MECPINLLVVDKSHMTSDITTEPIEAKLVIEGKKPKLSKAGRLHATEQNTQTIEEDSKEEVNSPSDPQATRTILSMVNDLGPRPAGQ